MVAIHTGVFSNQRGLVLLDLVDNVLGISILNKTTVEVLAPGDLGVVL